MSSKYGIQGYPGFNKRRGTRGKGRKINYIVGSTIVTGGIIVFMFMNAMSELHFGSSSGSGSNIFTPW